MPLEGSEPEDDGPGQAAGAVLPEEDRDVDADGGAAAEAHSGRQVGAQHVRQRLDPTRPSSNVALIATSASRNGPRAFRTSLHR